MKKIFTLILAIVLLYSCSTSSDGNGNSTTNVIPLAPTSLMGTANTTEINLSWTDNSTNETGFKIERKTGTGIYAVVGTTATDITTFSDIGLAPSNSYTYRVYAYNAVGNSLTYSNEINITTNFIDYPDVTIGNQIWLNFNLDVTTYRDGTPIPQVTDPTAWESLTTGAWCYYNNDSANGTTYGKLYNWFAVAGIHDTNPSTPNKILAPTGWHVPSDTEWTNLINYLGGNSFAGGKMKEAGTIHWFNNNPDSSNISGFTALPGGNRSVSQGNFGQMNTNGYWWSSTEQTLNSGYSWYREISSVGLDIAGNGNYNQKSNGLSVRCIKD